MSDLKQISLVLGGGGTRTANDLFKTGKQKEIAEEELYDLIERDQHLHEIMLSHAATRDVLREIYQALLKSGAGQWTGGHWVPASALACETTLDFVLTTQNAKQIVGVAAWTHVAFILIDYFEKGAVGPIRSQPLPI
ncbi:MAG TPA: hypothetical protein VI358_10960 [Pseudolabrys sp.]